MSKIEVIRRWRDNPGSPQNVLIPFFVLIGMEMFLNSIDAGSLTDDDKAAYDLIRREILSKKDRVRNRQAYTEFMRSSKSDKQAALDCYINTKKINSYH